MTNKNTTITSGSEIVEKIRYYISDHFLVDFDDEINDYTDLFKAGIIDSFGFIELVVFLEKNFNVKFKVEELVSNGLNSIKNMTAIIINKQNEN